MFGGFPQGSEHLEFATTSFTRVSLGYGTSFLAYFSLPHNRLHMFCAFSSVMLTGFPLEITFVFISPLGRTFKMFACTAFSSPSRGERCWT